jgi:hypothetical protein
MTQNSSQSLSAGVDERELFDFISRLAASFTGVDRLSIAGKRD